MGFAMAVSISKNGPKVVLDEKWVEMKGKDQDAKEQVSFRMC
jgi:hypothetical protein